MIELDVRKPSVESYFTKKSRADSQESGLEFYNLNSSFKAISS
jgi:hypothetical protein